MVGIISVAYTAVLIIGVFRLGTHAFYTVLSKKPEIYGASTLLKSLQFELSCNKRLKHRFRKVVRKGVEGVATLYF
jgi:hypothetical protein